MPHTIDQLGLGPLATIAAQDLLRVFGREHIWFTRGYADLLGQARAMAGNVVRNKEWIKQTYTRKDRLSYPVACQLQEAVYRNIDVNDRAGIAAYLYECLRGIPNAASISFHTLERNGQPAAEAFDLMPLEDEQGILTPIGRTVCEYIQVSRSTWHLDAFLKREGGLRIWHLQFLSTLDYPTG